MSRIAACFLILLALLASCAPKASDIVVVPDVIATDTVVAPTMTFTAVLQPTLSLTAVPSCSNEKVKIMPLGDSITYGEGDPNRGGYRTLLGTLLAEDGYQIDFVGSQKSGEAILPDGDNEGHPGWRITNIREAIQSEGWLETYQPDIILLHIGSNDLRHGRGVYARDNLSALLDEILARLPDVRIIVAQIIPTRWGSEVDHRIYNEAIPSVAASKGERVSVVDMRDILIKSDFMTLYHPNTSGYDKMARAWEAAILALRSSDGCLTH